MHDLYTREKFDWEPLNPFSLSLHEIRAQGSTPSATTEVGSYLVAAFRVSTVFFHPDSHFDIFLATVSQRTAPTVQPYLDLALFRIGNLVLILRRELSERPLLTRPPTEIPKSLSSRFRVIPRRTFRIQRLRPLFRVVDGAKHGCRQSFDVGHDGMDSHPVD